MLDVGATPEGLDVLVSNTQRRDFADQVWSKIGGIHYNAFRTELLPFIGQTTADEVTEAAWSSWCADVANAIEEICRGT